MTASLSLAAEADLDRLLPLVASYHAFEGIEQGDEARRAALAPILAGSPHGAIWLIGPRRAPVGYVAVSFGWSIELGGMDGFLDEFYVRESVRGRGMGGEVLASLLPQLAKVGLMGLSLETRNGNERTRRLYERLGFKPRDKYHLMTWRA